MLSLGNYTDEKLSFHINLVGYMVYKYDFNYCVKIFIFYNNSLLSQYNNISTD